MELAYRQNLPLRIPGLLQFSSDWLLRLRYNPFYDLLEARTLEWMDDASGRGRGSGVRVRIGIEKVRG